MLSMAVLSCWVMGALQGAILILVPEMMLQGQLSALQLALPLSLGTFVFMCFSGYWGKLLDAHFAANESLVLVIRWVLLGFLISQLSFIAFIQFSDFKGLFLVFALCLSRIIHGLFCSAIIPSAQLALSRSDKKGEKLVWSSIATNVGRVTAPLLTFVPADINYFSLWFIAAITFTAFILAWFNQDKPQPIGGNLSSMDTSSENESIEIFSLLNNPLLLSICVTAVLISLFSSQLQFSLGPLLLNTLSNANLASEMTAQLLFAASASALISLFILYRPLSCFPKIFLSVIAVSFITGCCLFAMQQQFIVAVVLISAALSMAPAWYTALAIHASKHNKARTSATISQGHTLGNAFGGLLGGLLLVLSQQLLLSSFILFMVMILLAWLTIFSRSNSYNQSQKLLITES